MPEHFNRAGELTRILAYAVRPMGWPGIPRMTEGYRTLLVFAF
jgi:hypothetical protein